jgi:hypothetical protein
VGRRPYVEHIGMVFANGIPRGNTPRYTLEMAIAIRKDAAEGNMKDLVKRYQEQGRPYITMTCLVANCGKEYLIYHEASTEPGQLRTGFTNYLERDHPNHLLMYEIDLSTESDPKIAGQR